jgi:arylsulfatase
MIDHDKNVDTVLAKIDELGLKDNTIVIYSTDNGPHMNTWPDAGTTLFRGEKNTNWEGAYRLPAMVRWPGHIKPGTVSNEIMSHLDWAPTLMAAAADDKIKQKLLKGHSTAGKKSKVHLDGFNFLPHLTNAEDKGPRKGFFYYSDDSDLTGLRYDNWKVVFAQQGETGTLNIWAEPFTKTRIPLLFNLRTDLYENATMTSNIYWDW